MDIMRSAKMNPDILGMISERISMLDESQRTAHLNALEERLSGQLADWIPDQYFDYNKAEKDRLEAIAQEPSLEEDLDLEEIEDIVEMLEPNAWWDPDEMDEDIDSFY